MPDIVIFEDKVDNIEATNNASNIPETQKLPASHINQLKSGVNTNHAEIGSIKSKTDLITVTQSVNLDNLASGGTDTTQIETDIATLNTAINQNISDINSISNKTDLITITQPIDLDNLPTGSSDTSQIEADIISLNASVSQNLANIGNISSKTDLITVTQPVNLDAIENSLSNKVSSDITGVTGADQITNMISLTQAEYDAIGTPNPSTFYVIVG